MKLRINLLTIALVALLLAACGRPAAAPTDPYQISITPDPAGYPGSVMRVQVLDEVGAPVTAATVSLEGNMNHAGMAPVLTEAVLDDADGAADGMYSIPFALTMLGDWIITVKVTPPEGDLIERTIELRAGEDAVTVE